MPRVVSRVVIPRISRSRVWAVLRDFERYPETMDDVLEIQVSSVDGDEATSSWRVLLDGAELSWTERDVFEPMKRIQFEQIEGDLECFRGEWRLETEGDGVLVILEVEFDLGVPSLSEVLNPLGIDAIESNSRMMLDAIRVRSQAPDGDER